VNEYRYQVRVACGWKVAAELLRRHHRKDRLRIIMAHPCGGQARQLYVMQDPARADPAAEFFTSLLALSFSDGMAHLLTGADAPDPKGWPREYIPDLLSGGDPKEVVDRLECAAGLPPVEEPLPEWTPPILAAKVLAALTARFALSSTIFDPECGWIDSSGYGTGICERLRIFPWIEKTLVESSSEREQTLQARSASKYWLLGPGFNQAYEARGVLSMGGFWATADQPENRRNLWEEFVRAGRNVEAVAVRILTMLGVEP